MILKFFWAQEQIDMYSDQERVWVKRTSKEEMSSMGDPAKGTCSEGKLGRREGLWKKSIYLHLAELRYRKWEESQEDRRERSDWKEDMSLAEEVGLKWKCRLHIGQVGYLEKKRYQLYRWCKTDISFSPNWYLLLCLYSSLVVANCTDGV